MSKNKIWDALKEKGYSDVAAAALMGNMEAESNCFAPRIQGDFSADYKNSVAYTEAVDDHLISENEFIYNGPGGGGYGLMQWTFWSRKKGLYELAEKMNASVGDVEVQIAWLDEELHSAEYAEVLAVLKNSVSIRDCTELLVRKYLRPADQSDPVCAYRAKLGVQLYDKFAEVEVEDQDGQTEYISPIKENEVVITQEEYDALCAAADIVMQIKHVFDMLEELILIE